MFDTLLGRGFAAKSKSAIIKLRNRLDIVRRKKKAVVGYLKRDIAELLEAGHDENAYGRIDGLINEMNRASCYDWIGKFCDSIYKQLSAMQKQRECPAEMKEAVSSLMYAAARIAELPELCTLRQTFSEKYDSSLELLVNQDLVEKLASKPPSMDQKLQLMQDVSQEFSIKWDMKACKHKISNPSPLPHAQPINQRFPGASKDEEEDALVEKKAPPPSKLYYVKETAQDEQNPQHYKREPLHSHKTELPTTHPKTNPEYKPRRDSNHNNPERLVNGWRHRADEHDHDHYEEEAQPKPKPKSVRKKPARPPQTDESAAAGHHSPMAATAAAAIVEDELEADKQPLHPMSRKTRGEDGKVVAPSCHGRASSLPVGEPPERAKTPARAASFRPDDARAEHVHPKLPDYDGLAARIALLRVGKL